MEQFDEKNETEIIVFWGHLQLFEKRSTQLFSVENHFEPQLQLSIEKSEVAKITFPETSSSKSTLKEM